ncbi:MAG: hypothetical protein CL811_12620 [Colwelliaceae bacterium]|nr:hypothetical protein [Colwelliaceae bacterium]|tara:strand:- start:854 stop:1192 length:339 start_codon:yes stop_codon:yes gene_type:complete
MEIQPVFQTEVKTWGNSNGIRVPAWILKAFKINKGEKVIVRIEKVSEEKNIKSSEKSELHNALVVLIGQQDYSEIAVYDLLESSIDYVPNREVHKLYGKALNNNQLALIRKI